MGETDEWIKAVSYVNRATRVLGAAHRFNDEAVVDGEQPPNSPELLKIIEEGKNDLAIKAYHLSYN